MKDIMNWLNRQGVKTGRNRAFTYGSVHTLLTNRRYIGENRFQDIVVPDTIPVIVEKKLFDRVQEKIAKNRRAPARHKAEDDYLLTTKLFCGMCGAMMFGECGTGRNKVVHHYYKCYNAKRTHSCKKKTVRKVWLEDLVVNATMKMLQDDQAIDAIVEMVMQLQDQENTTLPLLEKQLKETETGIQNMLNAIQAGILTSSTKDRLEALEAQKKELEIRITEEKLAKPKLSPDFVRFWLTRFRELNPQIKSHRETLVNTFVNAIYLYDDKVLITFNYKEGTKIISLDDVATLAASGESGSDLGCLPPPGPCIRRYAGFCFALLMTLRGQTKKHRAGLWGLRTVRNTETVSNPSKTDYSASEELSAGLETVMVSPGLPSVSMAASRVRASLEALVAPEMPSMSAELPAARMFSLSWGIHSEGAGSMG